mmetsp:Transcript_25560/g.55995  ORF Transcript_25560/g.55995 Transcript_25560/m.55995 type:complete len:223 (-) Transcript_25560:11-679(-)|eukprot:CAMPEP_0168170944 /NCGR_PEP_ID=MMETSP0139_2-20121125/4447_1 /TAXON_ID=44445 /ORGANISM="Pseudo-nitzschia australis, Strain 10249 10 AB" /LENGTH=222 /DNA_ID=CAMNT_0008088475 /DNA_START=193 /DNA_END=861 /DNA_ORIENTATION=-
MGKKGMLLFKGDKPKKKSKRSKLAKAGGRDETTTTTTDSQWKASRQHTSTTTPAAPSTPAASAAVTPTIESGTGRITTSGTVVSGHDTRFEKEISVGDAILVTLNNSTEEMRIVTMRLSNVSLNLSSAFSQNIRNAQNFRFVRKPRNLEQERKKERQTQLEEANETERSAFDIYDGKANTFTYREKTETGSYRVKQQQSSLSKSTRGDLLTLRSKKTSDKYC